MEIEEEPKELPEPEKTERGIKRRKPLSAKPSADQSVAPPASKRARTEPRRIEFLRPATAGKEGDVMTIGLGDVGQLGLGPDEKLKEKKLPGCVTLPEKVVEICAGGMHTVCLGISGKVYTFGCNDNDALGRLTPNDEDSFYPGTVELPGKAVGVSAGDSHTAALLEDGKVYAWGTFNDSSGGFGLTGTGNMSPTPIPILPNETVIKIASGENHLVMLSESGDLYTCGNAEQGQLGRVAEIFCKRGGTNYGVQFLLDPAPVTPVHFQWIWGWEKIVFENVWTGAWTTFAKVKGSDRVFVFGLNNYHQLGMDDDINIYYTPVLCNSFRGRTWQRISGGPHHTIALDSKGVVYTVGKKEYGALGLGQANLVDAEIPTAVEMPNFEKCIDVAAGIQVSYAVTESGKVLAWGMGSNNQLGAGKKPNGQDWDEDDKYTPIQMTGSNLENRKAFSISSGGQHGVILAADKE